MVCSNPVGRYSARKSQILADEAHQHVVIIECEAFVCPGPAGTRVDLVEATSSTQTDRTSAADNLGRRQLGPSGRDTERTQGAVKGQSAALPALPKAQAISICRFRYVAADIWVSHEESDKLIVPAQRMGRNTVSEQSIPFVSFHNSSFARETVRVQIIFGTASHRQERAQNQVQT